jgi:hypothetical protein
MLFAVSIGFLLFNLPFAIMNICKRYYGPIQEQIYFTKKDLRVQCTLDFINNLCHVLLDLSFVSNFLFFYLSGSRFRNKFCELCRMGCKYMKNTCNTSMKLNN